MTYGLDTWFKSNQLHVLVRENGEILEVPVTSLSGSDCEVHLELSVGEMVSVEITDVSLFIGTVTALHQGKSAVQFFRSTSH